MKWVLIIFLFSSTLYSQQEINLRQFTLVIPDSMVYGDTCNMSMHGYFHCNDITTQYFEIKMDTAYYYTVKRLGEESYKIHYVSIQKIPLANIDTITSNKRFDKNHWEINLESKRKTKRKGLFWRYTYWATGKMDKEWWRGAYMDCWDPSILDKIKLAIKNRN